MKSFKYKLLEMQGTKRRVGDIKSIFQNIEYNMRLSHISLISTNNCITFLYTWGHIIIYTFPQDRIITVEFLYQDWNKKIDDMIESSLQIFRPETHTIREMDRC